MNRTKAKVKLWRWEEGDSRLARSNDYLAAEEPLEMQLSAGGETRTLAITMRTPGNDYELAAGFLYGEGIIRRKEEIDTIRYCVGEERHTQEYNLLSIDLRRDKLPELPQLERHFFTNSACGICGSTLLEDLAERPLPPIPSGPQLPPALLTELPEKLRAAQALFESTGGLHAAALFDVDGNLLQVREDIGRHNALDKVIGWGVLNGRLPFHDHILMVSGRASYELLQKCYAAGGPVLCAVSAPSSLAVSLAQQFNITLVGFLRDKRFNVYTGKERLALAEKVTAG